MNLSKYTKIANYINFNPIAILGTTDDNNIPYGAVVYVCTDDHRPIVYFITKNGTRKYKNLVARPAVSITIVNPEDTSTLQAQGQANIVRDPTTIDIVTAKITRIQAGSPDWLPPVSKIHAGEFDMISVELTAARLAEYHGRQIGEPGIFTEV